MKYLLLLCSILSICCTPNYIPPCPPIQAEDLRNGIKSKDLGPVKIDGEECHIFEQYEAWNCHKINGEAPYNHPACKGETSECSWKILTRVTKCPSGTHTNNITYTPDKFRREVVQ